MGSSRLRVLRSPVNPLLRSGSGAAILVVAVVTGCIGPRPVTTPRESGGVITLPERQRATSSTPATIHTRREVVAIVAPRADSLWVQAPGVEEWRALPRELTEVESSRFRLSLEEEGRHLVATATVEKPNRSPVLRIVLDRTPPTLRLRCEERLPRRQGDPGDLWVQWRAADENSIEGPVSIEVSGDGGESWRVVARTRERGGELVWPLPAPPWDRHALRFRAEDPAGNETLRTLRLGEELVSDPAGEVALSVHEAGIDVDRVGALEARWQSGERGVRFERERALLEHQTARALNQNPASVELRRCHARLLLLRDPPDRSSAIRILEIGLARDDSDPRLWSDCAVIESARGRYDAAEEAQRRALALQETAPRRANLARILLAAGRPAAAQAELRRAIVLEPDAFEYRVEWARATARLPVAERRAALEEVERWRGAPCTREQADRLREILAGGGA